MRRLRIALEMKQILTTESVANTKQAVFIRVSDVTRTYGLKRGFLYHMVKAGLLKSTTLKGRCGMKGIVLFRPEDIENLIKTQSAKAKK
jgi:predicted DNA-binding transcriptional regulator AlpA